MKVTDDEKQRFLNDDLYNELRWLFVGAVTWVASEDHAGNKDPLAMTASLTHSRALYEFYYSDGKGKPKSDDARAIHFCTIHPWTPADSGLYKNYMAAQKSANKRVFHLVYNRPIRSGGVTNDESSHALQKALREAAKKACTLRINDPFGHDD